MLTIIFVYFELSVVLTARVITNYDTQQDQTIQIVLQCCAPASATVREG
jgi:hypothetical protein